MTCCSIIELRQYSLHRGQRQTLIDLFDREFVETQEAEGMSVIGQFSDLDDPDRFVWLRGFDSMEARKMALSAFYGGPIWKAHRAAANATMIDSDNVLLLRPVGEGFDLTARSRDAPGNHGMLVAEIHYLDAGSVASFIDFFQRCMAPAIAAAGASVLAMLTTETSANSFPALPVREGEHVFVWFARFADVKEHGRYLARAREENSWRESAPRDVLRQLMRRPERLRLAPTDRSLLA